jgi:hypothetical protein
MVISTQTTSLLTNKMGGRRMAKKSGRRAPKSSGRRAPVMGKKKKSGRRK